MLEIDKYNDQIVLPAIVKIEKYLLSKKHPKDFSENLKNLTKKELAEIVSILLLIMNKVKKRLF